MVIDPETRELKSHEQKIVHEGQKVIKDKVKAEMHQAVVEVGTDICADVDEALHGCCCIYEKQFLKLRTVLVLRWVLQAHIHSVIGKAN